VKCLYYLTPSLISARRISEDLHEAGVNDWFIHVVSHDEAGLKREQIHSSNYLETLDLLRAGAVGANLGFIAGVIGAGLIMYFQPFGPDMPGYVYLIIIVVATMFGSWEGGLYGVATENQKLRRFQHDLEAGKHLMLIYASNKQEARVKLMMRTEHPEAQHVATDRHFVNPFSVVRRLQIRRRSDARRDMKTTN